MLNGVSRLVEYDIRDALLRWIANRRGIEVASMVADRRTEDMMFAEARSGTADDIEPDLVPVPVGPSS